jgi:hypothetical protein
MLFCVHPEDVCNVVITFDWSGGFLISEVNIAEFTPSIISISPLFGQSSPTSHIDGHVPKPSGICWRSKINSPPLNVWFDSNLISS